VPTSHQLAHARIDRRRGFARDLLIQDRLHQRGEGAAAVVGLKAAGAHVADDRGEDGIAPAHVRRRLAQRLGIEAMAASYREIVVSPG
jgi:hypothetical protein